MFRVLLPDGELTLSSRIEFLKETDNSVVGVDICISPYNANAVFVHLKAPYTTHKGVLLRGLTQGDIEDIKSMILKNGYYDFSRLVSNGCFFCNLSEDEISKYLGR